MLSPSSEATMSRRPEHGLLPFTGTPSTYHCQSRALTCCLRDGGNRAREAFLVSGNACQRMLSEAPGSGKCLLGASFSF